MNDITEIKRAMSADAEAVARYLLPAGKVHGREFEVGSINGEVGQSLRVCVSGAKQGVWSDFASGQGGDLIELWCLVRRMKLSEALADIRAWLGLEAQPFDRQERSYKRPAPANWQGVHGGALDYLVDHRQISEEAISVYHLGEKGRDIIFPYFLPDGELAQVKRIGLDRDHGKKRISVEADCEPVLFGWQAISDDAREVTITEGEIDAVTMWDYGFPALSVPFGGGKGAKQQWIEREFERLFRFEVINLALDHDAEGDIAAEEIANRLGRHRCRRVKLPHKDANECRQKGVTQDVIAECIRLAESLDPPELRRAGEFLEGARKLFYPTGEREAGYRLPFAKIGDKFICRPGELTIWTGQSNDGKSQLLSHCAVSWIADGARICEASFEMAPAQQLKRKIKQAGNIDRPTNEYLDHVVNWLNTSLWMTRTGGKAKTSNVIEIFEYARSRHGCDVFILDSLMRLGIAPDDFSAQETAVYELTNWTQKSGVHLHLVAHSRKPDTRSGHTVPNVSDVKGASEIGSNAHNILGIWRNKDHENKIKIVREKVEAGNQGMQLELDELEAKPPVLLNIAKQRSGDFDGVIGLWFNQKTYQYRSAHDPKDGVQYVQFDRT
jgi:twinkle protein